MRIIAGEFRVIGGLHGRQAREGLLPGGGGDEEYLGRLGAAAHAR